MTIADPSYSGVQRRALVDAIFEKWDDWKKLCERSSLGALAFGENSCLVRSRLADALLQVLFTKGKPDSESRASDIIFLCRYRYEQMAEYLTTHNIDNASVGRCVLPEFKKSLHQWVAVCEKQEFLEEAVPFIELGLTPAMEIENILYAGGNAKNAHRSIHPYFADKEEGRRLGFELINNWFLLRYDMGRSWRLLCGLNGLPGLCQHAATFLLVPWLALLAVACAVATDHNPLNGLVWASWGALGAWVLVTPFLLWSRRLKTMLWMLLPRIAAAIVLGLTIVALQNDTWGFAYKAERNWTSNWVLGGAGIVWFLNLFYIWYEATTHLPEQQALQTLKEALSIFSIATFQALVFTAAACDLLTPLVNVSKESLPVSPQVIAGCFSQGIHLTTLFLFASVALTIGFIAQIFWEREPLTTV